MSKHQTGELNTLVAFDAPTEVSNGMGGTESGWAEQFQAWTKVIWLRGGETVMAARLAGRQPAVFVIGLSDASLLLETNWRARDVSTGAEFAVKAQIPSDDRAFLEVTVESGITP